MRHRIGLTICTLWGCLLLLGPAHAQGLGTYEPSSPTVSPYLNLLRSNFGPLPNYHSLVRPQLRQQTFNREASREIQYNLRQLNALSQTPPGQEPTGNIRVRQSQVAPTGLPGQFQYFSHYFPPPRSALPRR